MRCISLPICFNQITYRITIQRRRSVNSCKFCGMQDLQSFLGAADTVKFRSDRIPGSFYHILLFFCFYQRLLIFYRFAAKNDFSSDHCTEENRYPFCINFNIDNIIRLRIIFQIFFFAVSMSASPAVARAYTLIISSFSQHIYCLTYVVFI